MQSPKWMFLGSTKYKDATGVTERRMKYFGFGFRWKCVSLKSKPQPPEQGRRGHGATVNQ